MRDMWTSALQVIMCFGRRDKSRVEWLLQSKPDSGLGPLIPSSSPPDSPQAPLAENLGEKGAIKTCVDNNAFQEGEFVSCTTCARSLISQCRVDSL